MTHAKRKFLYRNPPPKNGLNSGFPRLVKHSVSDTIPVEPHEAVPEVSKGKVHITQNKHVPIEWFVTTASQSRI